ncbi:hypothetical protein LMG27198_43960 [Methylocystis echinoides]|uniref:Uncharacterized protein n=1 Tax=Methylocystis echinoides TaxID=29468 RepID=A0A9W6GYU6_9HYPH|nr:hypothetical protein LMG27198_43960 [Methylocystis echinoides]
MTLIDEIDYGTPASKSQNTVTLTIDGKTVTAPEGTSVMRAAMAIGTESRSYAQPTAWTPLAPAAFA